MPQTPIQPPLRLALLGAGTFARDAYLPSLAPHADTIQVAAIYSRTLANAQALVERLPYPADAGVRSMPRRRSNMSVVVLVSRRRALAIRSRHDA